MGWEGHLAEWDGVHMVEWGGRSTWWSGVGGAPGGVGWEGHLVEWDGRGTWWGGRGTWWRGMGEGRGGVEGERDVVERDGRGTWWRGMGEGRGGVGWEENVVECGGRGTLWNGVGGIPGISQYFSLFHQTIVWDLYDSLEGVQDPSSLQIAIMSFINALISFKAGEVCRNSVCVGQSLRPHTYVRTRHLPCQPHWLVSDLSMYIAFEGHRALLRTSSRT